MITLGGVLIFLLILAFIAITTAVVSWGDEFLSRKPDLIARADQQHAALMNGNERLGVHGQYPPADLS